MIPAIIGAAAGMLGTAMQNNAIKQQNDQSYLQQQYLMGLQNQYATMQANAADERTRNLFNDLQSPAAIKAQLEKAGLSVGLMYGQGGMQGSLQQGAQGEAAGAPSRSMIPYQNIMNAETQMLMANAAKIKAETENIEKDTELKGTEAESNRADLPLKAKELDVMNQQIEESQKRIEEYNAQINKLFEEKINIAEDSENKRETRKLIQAQTQWQQAQTTLTNIDIAYRGQIHQATINQLKAAANQMNAAARLAGIQADVLESQKQLLYDKLLLEVETQGKEFLNWDEKFKNEMDLMKENKQFLISSGQAAGNKAISEKQKNDYYIRLNHRMDGLGDFMRVLNEDLLGDVGAGVVIPIK